MSSQMPPLPIDPLLKTIAQTVRDSAQVILTATPGAGKTTRLPPELLQSVPGKIAVLEPRRMAAVAACARVAHERGWEVGREVGYQVRFESRRTDHTRIVYMTDALFLRRLVSDPEVNDFDLVVLDEFHERGLNQDLILGAIKELQDLGREIKLLVMSATLDIAKLKRYMPEAQVIDVPGKVFPLEIRHSDQPQRLLTDTLFYSRVSDAVLKSVRETTGDILVFLPGQGEIHRMIETVESLRTGRELVALHGSLSLEDQKNVLRGHERPRIIFATNIAEASVTVPGVDRVIDSGLARVLETNLTSGFSRLTLTRIAQFNARQRAGRAARQKEGVCLRLWSVHEESTLEEQMAPECERVDLASSLLLLAHLGVRDFKMFAWLDAPPTALITMATQSLRSLAAIDDENQITAVGKKLLAWPVPPRWGGLLLISERLGNTRLAARSAALLQDRDIAWGPQREAAPVSDADECDLTSRLQWLDEIERGGRPHGVSIRQAQAVLEAARQLESLVSEPPRPTGGRSAAHLETTKQSASRETASRAGDADFLRRLLLLSQGDRLCRRRKASERGIMVGGRGVKLAKESQVKTSEFFISLAGIDLPGQPDTTVALACGVSKEVVLDVLKDRVEMNEDVYFDEAKGEFLSRRIRRFRDLDLDEPVLTRLSAEQLGPRLVDALVARWPSLSQQHEGLQSWLARWHFFEASAGAASVEVPRITPDIVRKTCEIVSFGKSQMSEILKQDFVGCLESQFDRNILRQFQQEVPKHFQAPSGFQHAIHYSPSEPPFVEVRLQEVFGLLKTPRLGFGRTPLTFKLLAPNYRPVQVTSDIEGFWTRAYVEVRKELRGRYPKHSWPDDPFTAIPVAKGSRRR